jgi:hypothetical protein
MKRSNLPKMIRPKTYVKWRLGSCQLLSNARSAEVDAQDPTGPIRVTAALFQ